MKSLLKEVTIQSLSLYFTSLVLSGLKINNIESLLLGGLLLVLGYKILSPIFQIILLPFNLISFGLFSSFTTVVSLFIMTRFLKGINVQAFTFPEVSLYTVKISSFSLSPLLSFIAISVTIYFLGKLLEWLFEVK